MKLLIQIEHTLNPSRARDIAKVIDLDKGELAIPDSLAVGQRTWDNRIIGGYSNQVDEYDVWLEDQIKNENLKVMSALEEVFQYAATSGVILVTSWIAAHTHAHVVKRTIERLAANLEPEPAQSSAAEHRSA